MQVSINLNDICLPTSDIKFCMYIKFYETKIKFIEKWVPLFKEIIDRNICAIYVWIESQLDYKLINYQLPFPDKIKYITHFNKTDYCNNIVILEKIIQHFMNDVGINQQFGHCQAHLKSFIFPKEEYIIHIDGDDMFYDNLTANDLNNLYNFAKSNNASILSRPYWITVNRGWSFGFVIQKKELLKNMFVFNSFMLGNNFKKDGFKEKNKDMIKCLNLDNYFGMILFDYYKIPCNKLFFHFKSFPFWSDCVNTDQQFINKTTTEKFCNFFNIIEI